MCVCVCMGVCYYSVTILYFLQVYYVMKGFSSSFTSESKLLFNYISVSYTHLDVYKRQQLCIVSSLLNLFE